MIYPEKSKYIEDSQIFNLIPVCQEIRVDSETPVSIFKKLKAKILLESVEQGENVGRFSIIGLGKRTVITMKGRSLNIKEFHNNQITASEDYQLENPLNKVREYFQRFNVPEIEGLPPFYGGAIGYLGYETLQYFEDVPVNQGSSDDVIPDGLMLIPETVLVYDSVKRSVFIIVLTTPGRNGDNRSPDERYQFACQRIDEICKLLSTQIPLNGKVVKDSNRHPAEILYQMEKSKFLDSVKICKDYIKAGDIIQVVISQKFNVNTSLEPFEFYRTLRVLNPSPYLFFLDFDDFCLVGSSPEVMVRVQDGEILLKPIAGTRKRGKTISEDAEIARELLADPKELAEHVMLVDLGRNDLGRVAVPGSVRVTDYMKIEKYSHVMHIVSTIKAEMDKNFDVFDVIKASFPAGTLTGAPKIRAIEIITELEDQKRGPYGGMVFNLGFKGKNQNMNLDSCITIRTIVLKDNVACIQAGAGIVADSDPENEYQETVNKARALIEAIELTNKEV